MNVLREYIGGSEIIDVDTESGYEEFARGVVQDYDLADDYITQMRAGKTVEVNADQPEFYERYRAADS